MKNFKVTKLKLTSEASARLIDLGLSPADLDVVLCFGRKLLRDGLIFYVFDQSQLAATHQEFAHLAGTILIVSSGRIIDVCRQSHKSEETEQVDADDNR